MQAKKTIFQGPLVCYHSTDPVTKFLLGNEGFKVSRAFHVNAIRTLIIVDDDTPLPPTI